MEGMKDSVAVQEKKTNGNSSGRKLDSKDYEILYELDNDFRQSFSAIGKKVRLSKNSVALRFEKLKEYMLHNMTGLNHEILGFKFVRVFYTFDFYNEDTEKAIVREVGKHPNVIYAARYYGLYDICLGLYVNNLDDFIKTINQFDERFSGRISRKDIQILHRQTYFRYNFLHKRMIEKGYSIGQPIRKVNLSELDKKILTKYLYEPRINIVDVARALRISTKTVSNRMKMLEKNGVVMGYFMTLNPVKFGHNTFILLLQFQNMKKSREFDEYLKNLKNVKYTANMLGFWDYEIDFIYPSITALQEQIENMKQKFPNLFKKMEIISFGRRIATNKRIYLS